ncbi:hypothetical protein BC829DRAFT_389336 [Chytridium lagenaria]|nr:hypothetical protein BC829DRAFT_389336 [Chytridium lagenaria]
MQQQQPQPKFRNLYSSSPFKAAYSNVRIDSTASGLSTVAVAWGGTNGSIGVFGVHPDTTDTKKVEINPPYLLTHNKQIADFAFSPLNDRILASSCRSDALIRLWKIPTSLSLDTLDECDSPDLFLAGHEKKVDVLRFHPTVGGVIVSGSLDSSMKIWDIEAIQDKITLSIPNNMAPQCMCFDYGGDALGIAANDGMLHIYDPRARIKTLWLSPDPLLITSGFSRQGQRELCLYDTRKLEAPLNKIVDDRNGTGILHPFWDPALPLVYISSKGEGLRVYEVLSGNITLVGNMKSDKQVTQADLLPKSGCNTSKCEIARFVRLGTDNVIDFSCIHVPRANGESVYQDDLYPPYATVNPDITPTAWFDNYESVEPLMVDMVATSDATLKALPKLPPLPKISTGEGVFTIKPPESSRSIRKSATLRRSPTVQTKSADVTSSVDISPKLEVAKVELHLESKVSLQKPGWFSTSWESQYLRLRKANIYIFESKDAENPISCVLLPQIEKIEGFAVGKDVCGFAFDFQGVKYKYKFDDIKELSAWKEALLSIGVPVSGFSISLSPSSPQKAEPSLSMISPGPANTQFQLTTQASNTHLSPTPKPFMKTPSNSAVANSLGLAVPTSHNSKTECGDESYAKPQQSQTKRGSIAHAALVGTLEILVETVKGKPAQWFSRLVALQNDGMLCIYSDDMKAYAQKKPPSEIMDFTKAISVRLTTISDPRTINQTAYEAANWVVQTQRILDSLNFSSDTKEIESHEPVEGWVKSQFQWDRSPAWYWLCIADYKLFYYKSQLSLIPVAIKLSGDIVDLRLFGSFSGKEVAGHSREDSNSRSYHSRSLHVRAPSSGRSSTVARKSVTVSSEDALNFEIVFCGETLTHRVGTVTERDRWLSELEKFKLESIDVLGSLGVGTDEDFKNALSKVGNTEADMAYFAGLINAQVIDDGRLTKGEEKTLTQVMGKAFITISFVKCDWTSIRSDCAYVLDTGSLIYHWNGDASSRIARAKALDVASRLRKERSNRPKVVLVENDEAVLLATFAKHLNARDPSFFFNASAIPSQNQNEIDLLTMPIKIYNVSSSKLLKRRIRLIYEGYIPSKKLLESENVYIVQSSSEVFVWTGKGCLSEHRTIAYMTARRMASESLKTVNWMTIQRSHYERESAVFREKFIDYEGSLPISMRMAEAKGNVATKIAQKPIDVKQMLQMEFDDGKSGKASFFLVKDFTRESFDPRFIGQLFNGDSYIICYTYRPPGSGVDRTVSYFWQGSASKITQKGTSAMMTVELSKETSGEFTQIRVPEGKEPKHFLQMFPSNNFIVRKGSIDSEKKKTELSGIVAFDVRTVFGGLCKAIEIEPSEMIFNSNTVYVVTNGSIAFVWEGCHSNKTERAFAKEVSTKITSIYSKKSVQDIENSIITVAEGSQNNEFYSILQNINVAIPVANLVENSRRYEPRLFACSATSGMVTIEEVSYFSQEDLDYNICYLLDAYTHIFVWFGTNSKVNEKVVAMETAEQYSGLLENRAKPIILVTYAYSEPSEFTKQFHGWTKAKVPAEKRNIKSRTRPVDEVLREYKRETFSVDILLGDKVPENVDVTKLELYLTEDDFEALFKMKKEEYLAIQPWKREKIRKEVGFF